MSLKYRQDNKPGKLYSVANPARIDVGADNDLPSMTRQEFTDECDINRLMAKYESHKFLPNAKTQEPMYLDFCDMPDLPTAMRAMMDAEEAFMSLPARVRREFDNDAMRFVEYASDAGNSEQLVEWGLAAPPAPPEKPIEVRVVADPPPPGDAPKPTA